MKVTHSRDLTQNMLLLAGKLEIAIRRSSVVGICHVVQTLLSWCSLVPKGAAAYRYVLAQYWDPLPHRCHSVSYQYR